MKKLLLALTLSFMLSGCVIRIGGFSSNAEMIADAQHGIFLIHSDKSKDIWTDEPHNGGMGTGVLIGENLILTAAHVINEAEGLQVSQQFSPNDYDAKVKWADKVMDIAIIEIVDYDKFKEENEDVKITEFAEDYRVGDTVFAIGHPISEDYTATKGSISFIGRKIDPTPRYMIQTDTQILQGNSGGPLLDLYGKIVGINDIIKPVMGGTLSYSVPADMIQKAIHDWEKYGEIRWTTVGFTMERNMITGVLPESPAELAGLKTGDRILDIDIDGEEFQTRNSTEIVNAITESNYESDFTFTVQDSEGDILDLDVVPQYKKSDEFLALIKEYRREMSERQDGEGP